MACLTPGVLVKLIENMDNAEEDTNINGFGGDQRRTPLLQILSIVPVLSDDDLWSPNKGFYLKVSDSSHATYVSLPREYDELILTNKLQIGHFIYVQKLDNASPVPFLRGVKPLPRRHACVGCPVDLLITSNAPFDDDLRSPKVMGSALPRPRSMSASRVRDNDYRSCKIGLMGSGSAPATPNITDRLSKVSIACAADDTDSDGSEPNSAGRATTARRSWDVGKAPTIKDQRPGAKNQIGLARAMSVDICPSQLVRNENSKSHTSASTSSSKTIEANSQYAFREGSKLASKVYATSSNRKTRVAHNPSIEAIDDHLNKSSYWNENGDGVPWASLSPDLVKLGKGMLRYKDSAVIAAVDALQEAAAMEKLIKCLSIYSELLSKNYEPQICVERFLNLQEDLTEIKLITRSLKNKQVGSSDVAMLNSSFIKEAAKIKLERKKRAATWVKSALASDLSPPSPSTRPPLHPSETSPTYRKPSTIRKPRSPSAVSRERKSMNDLQIGSVEWIKGNSMVASTDLTEALLVESKRWFLEHADKFLDGITNSSNHSQIESEIAGILCLIKRIDNWLSKQVIKSADNVEEIRAHGKLKKKIYSILLQHVESAAMALESVGSAG